MSGGTWAAHVIAQAGAATPTGAIPHQHRKRRQPRPCGRELGGGGDLPWRICNSVGSARVMEIMVKIIENANASGDIGMYRR